MQTVPVQSTILDAHTQPLDSKTVSSSWCKWGTEQTLPVPWEQNCKQPVTSVSVTKWFAVGFMTHTSIPDNQQSDLALLRLTALLVLLGLGVIWHGEGSSGSGCSLRMSHGSFCPSRLTQSFNDWRIWGWRCPGECFYDATVRAQWLWRQIRCGEASGCITEHPCFGYKGTWPALAFH